VARDRVEIRVPVEQLRACPDCDCCDQAVREPADRRTLAAAGAVEGRRRLVIGRLLKREELAAIEQPVQVAGLALVSDELHEAAKVDGATAWQRFWRITVPLMKPAILVALLFRTLDAFRIFDSVYVISNNGVNRPLESVSVLGYNTLLNRLNLGLGSAVSVLIFLFVIVIAALFVKGLGTSLDEQTGGR